VFDTSVGAGVPCRYYVAEGVRLYSQETWRQVMGTTGRAKVAKYIDQVGTLHSVA